MPEVHASMAPRFFNNHRLLAVGSAAVVLALMYTLRGVLVPLLLAFAIAYALDPVVDRLERWRIPRGVAAPLVMLLLIAAVVTVIFLGVPVVVDELRGALQRLPEQLEALRVRAEQLLWDRFHYRLPETWSELVTNYGADVRRQLPDAARVGGALFGTMNAILVGLGTLVIPIFALYLLIDFHRILSGASSLVPRRWAPHVTSIGEEIHRTLGRYVRGQLITNVILSVLYATGLSIVGIRMAIPIGVMTGMLAFVPYIGLAFGTTLAVLMALLDWQSTGQLVAVVAVMGGVGLLDGMVITPRIVGGSVGLRPIEVLLTMMASATLFGFLGVLLAVPIGAVLKILLHRVSTAYLSSRFYLQPSRVLYEEPSPAPVGDTPSSS